MQDTYGTAIKPGINKKTIKQVLRKEKTWTARSGIHTGKCVRPWTVTFNDGYTGEMVWPQEDNLPFRSSDEIYFRVGYRKDGFPDEIEAVPESAVETVGLQEQAKAANGQASMNGHPAVTAIHVAKDIIVAKITASPTFMNIAKKELFELAEDVHKWLIEKK